MITKKVEVSIMLEASTVDKLRRAARSGWLSPSTSGDWEHLVEDWLVGQVHDASD